MRLLVKQGGDVSTVGDSCGIALKAALAAGWDSQRLYDILQYLVDEGGTHYYRAALRGAYPNALDAARSPDSKAQPDLLAMLSDKMKCSDHEESRELQRSPPFPMPYMRSEMANRPSSRPNPKGICDLPAYAALTAQHADISCAILEEELIIKVLV